MTNQLTEEAKPYAAKRLTDAQKKKIQRTLPPSLKRVEILREERSLETGKCKMILLIALEGGGVAEIPVSRRRLTETTLLYKDLVECGLAADPESERQVKALAKATNFPRTSVTSKAGWLLDLFVSPFGVFGKQPSDGIYAFDHGADAKRVVNQKGDVRKFVTGAAKFLQASDEFCLLYGAALLAPLAARARYTDGFSINLSGQGSVGKTTAVLFARSLSAKAHGDGDLANFGDTVNIVTNSMPERGAQLVCFTDVKSGTEKGRDLIAKIQTIVFDGQQGTTRKRMGYANIGRPSYLINLLSTEQSLQSLFEAEGASYADGERGRILDIPVASRAEGGIFSRVTREVGDHLFKEVYDLIGSNYGTITERWCTRLSQYIPENLREWMENRQVSVAQTFGEQDHLGTRISRHFNMVLATGRMASKARLLPIPYEDFMDAILRCFDRVMESTNAGSVNGLQRENDIIDFLLDATKFPLIVKSKLAKEEDCKLGFRRDEEKIGEVLYLSLHQFSNYPAFEANDIKRTIDVLKRANVIRTGPQVMTRDVAQKGLAKSKRLHINLGLLHDLRKTRQSA